MPKTLHTPDTEEAVNTSLWEKRKKEKQGRTPRKLHGGHVWVTDGLRLDGTRSQPSLGKDYSISAFVITPGFTWCTNLDAIYTIIVL